MKAKRNSLYHLYGRPFLSLTADGGICEWQPDPDMEKSR